MCALVWMCMDIKTLRTHTHIHTHTRDGDVPPGAGVIERKMKNHTAEAPKSDVRVCTHDEWRKERWKVCVDRQATSICFVSKRKGFIIVVGDWIFVQNGCWCRDATRDERRRFNWFSRAPGCITTYTYTKYR